MVSDVQLRPATNEDLDEIINLIQRLGLESGHSKDSVIRLWHYYSYENPFFDKALNDFGWTLIHDEQIVGYFGNLLRRFTINGQSKIVAVASTWAVEKQHRKHVPDLCDRYFDQKGVDVYLVTTAIPATERIFSRYSGLRLPDKNYNEVLFWILNLRSFFEATLRKKSIMSQIATTIGVVIAPISWMLSPLLRVRYGLKAKPKSDELRIYEDADFDKIEFDRLWERVSSQDTRFMAWRSAEALAWHFKLMQLRDRPCLITYGSEEGVKGYVMLNIQVAKSIKLRRARIVDIFIENDDLSILTELVQATLAYATEQRAHVVEVSGMLAKYRDHLEKCLKPFKRTFPCFPYNYRLAPNSDLKVQLADINGWYPSLLDGDSFL